jgi:hypothetical protein
MDGVAETNIEWRYVDASRAPVRPHGILNTPILSGVGVCGFCSACWCSGEEAAEAQGFNNRETMKCCCPPAD